MANDNRRELQALYAKLAKLLKRQIAATEVDILYDQKAVQLHQQGHPGFVSSRVAVITQEMLLRNEARLRLMQEEYTLLQQMMEELS